jgi:uncharacterized protein YfiM (DUF2279 family)
MSSRTWNWKLVTWNLLLCGCASFRHPGDAWWGADKAKHFAAGAALGAAAAGDEGEPVPVGVGVAFAFGAGKEVYDREIKGTYFSGKDLMWGLAGGLAGAWAVDAAR